MLDQLAFDAAAAAQAGEDGMDKARRAERVQFWKEDADLWLTYHRGREFTADDLVAEIGLPDEGVNRNNVVGAWMSAQARLGKIRFAGRMRKSRRVIRHGNVQRVWIVN